MSAPYIVSIVCFAFCLFIFFYLKWYIKRRTSVEELLAEYRTEVYRLNAQIDAVTDRDSQLVEERIKKLNSILDETEKRIAVYVRELERSKSGEALYTSLGRGIRAALKTPADGEPAIDGTSGEQSALLVQTAKGGTTEKKPKLSIIRGPDLRSPSVKSPAPLEDRRLPLQDLSQTASESESEAQKAPGKKQLRDEIEKYLKQGLSASDIASRLEISISEVDLAINLLSRQKK